MKMKQYYLTKIAFVSLLFFSTHLCTAKLRCASFFGSNMVLQRECKAAIWGWAEPHEKIKLTASWGAKAEATADDQGAWKLHVQTPKAGGSYTLSIQGATTLRFENVMSGDVWFCAGQSNMFSQMKRYYSADRVAQEANASKIRLFRSPTESDTVDRTDVEATWTLSNVSDVAEFSATGYFFGRRLEESLKENVPIGLIQSAWGGRLIESFIPWEHIKDDNYVHQLRKKAITQAKNYDKAKEEQRFKLLDAKWKADYNKWKKEGSKGVAPKRAKFKTNPIYAGNFAGGTYSAIIHPFLGLSIKGVIWYQGEANSKKIKGGGSATDYQRLLTRMIGLWRKEWGIGDFPFYFVQLPNCHAEWTKAVELKDSWAYTRESMLKTALKVPHTGVAITIGLGEADNVHPHKKQEVGDRLAFWALKNQYKHDIAWTGPLAKTCQFKKDKAIITFENGGADLTFDNGQANGFAVIDEQGEIFKAKAKIIAPNQLEVSATGLTSFKAVYYAWANNPEGANLKNKADLPASPFRFSK